MSQLNNNNYYVGNITTTTFKLYSDSSLSTKVNSSAYTAYNNGGTVQLTTSNLDVYKINSNNRNITTEGAVTLNARKLFDIVKELPNEEIHIKKEERY